MTNFTSLQEAESFKAANHLYLQQLQEDVRAIPGVEYSDIWLNGSSPSFVAGYDIDDCQIVSFKI